MKKLYFLPLLLLVFSCQRQVPNFDLAIHNVNIIDIETGNITAGQSVFMVDDTIHSIVSTRDLVTSQAKQNIDGSDQYLLPGFWDNHVHFRGGDSLIAANKNFLNLFIANGITTVRECGGDMTHQIHDWQKEIAAGDLVGPTIYTSGPKIDGPGARWAGSLEVSTDEDVTKAIDSLQALNVDFVKLYESTISGDMYLKAIKEATDRGMITSGHMPFTVTLDETIEAGIGASEHLYYILKGCSSKEKEITEAVKSGETSFWSSLAQVMQTYSDSVAQSQFKKLVDNNVFVVPTLYIGNTLSYLDEADHTSDKYLKYMDPRIEKTYEGRIKSALNAPPAFVAMRKKLDSTFVELAGKLQDNGVSLLAGSDCGAFNSYIYPGISLHKELKALVDAGLTPLEALQTSALNGARFLEKEKPAVAVGKSADLVLLSGNPLKDITQTENIVWVIKNGKAYDDDALKAMLK
ncbi:amidohydrolase family protein [Leeuwenhoekiella sp. A16]|uniref:amidohydrolase family protein n=1 Tax=unclassified Leeuwenhoekiella TaxID=2615029 RepID=UPI003A81208F